MDRHNYLETQRMILLPYKQRNAEDLFRIQSDPEVSRYTIRANSVADAEHRYVVNESRRKQDGFAPWVVRSKENEKVIGYGGLTIDSFDPGWGIEVMYFFAPESWGKGLATELVAKALSIGFDKLGLPEIAAFAKPKNKASIRVLEKNGFEFVRYESHLERNHYFVRGSNLVNL
ncbi:GNAT family N-acetyltransferase [Chloroflexota bacterium]